MSYFGIVSKSGGGDVQLLAHMQFINSNYDFELLKIDIQ